MKIYLLALPYNYCLCSGNEKVDVIKIEHTIPCVNISFLNLVHRAVPFPYFSLVKLNFYVNFNFILAFTIKGHSFQIISLWVFSSNLHDPIYSSFFADNDSPVNFIQMRKKRVGSFPGKARWFRLRFKHVRLCF